MLWVVSATCHRRLRIRVFSFSFLGSLFFRDSKQQQQQHIYLSACGGEEKCLVDGERMEIMEEKKGKMEAMEGKLR